MHYIFSGALTPRRLSVRASTMREASQSAKRARRVASSSASTWAVRIELVEQRCEILRVMRQAERRAISCRLGNHVSEISHLAHEGKLRFLAQRREVHVGADRCARQAR